MYQLLYNSEDGIEFCQKTTMSESKSILLQLSKYGKCYVNLFTNFEEKTSIATYNQ